MYKSREAKKILFEKYGWQDYGAKHEESIFTQWFQNFYLFEKFGIDKRRAHLSSLINSEQLDRDTALKIIQNPPLYTKMGIEEEVMEYPKHSHYDYATDEKLFNFISKIVKFLR